MAQQTTNIVEFPIHRIAGRQERTAPGQVLSLTVERSRLQQRRAQALIPAVVNQALEAIEMQKVSNIWQINVQISIVKLQQHLKCLYNAWRDGLSNVRVTKGTRAELFEAMLQVAARITALREDLPQPVQA